MRQYSLFLCLCAAVTASGCGGSTEKPFTKATVKVSGTITVNGGTPEWPIQLEARPVTNSDPDHPSVSMATTDENGMFEFSTYAPGDGVPEGKYYLLATSQEMNMLSRTYEGPDRLGGKYSTITKPAKEFEATGTEPIELDEIDLQAAAAKKK